MGIELGQNLGLLPGIVGSCGLWIEWEMVWEFGIRIEPDWDPWVGMDAGLRIVHDGLSYVGWLGGDMSYSLMVILFGTRSRGGH